MDTTNEKQLAYLAATRKDLKFFLYQAFATINSNKAFLDNWHIDAIVHCLEEAIEGRMPRLTINLPPRHLKSFIVSVALPAFVIGLDPAAKIICVSYSDELARALSRDFRRIIESEWYERVFPHVETTKMTENEFTTSEGGGRLATSVGGTLTGRGGDFIIIDDPIKPEDILSEKSRISANDWYRSTLLSRLDDKAKSVLILVMQRLHVNDLTGFVEAGGGFHKLSFPAIAIRDEAISLGSRGIYRRYEGEALHPERENLATLQGIRDQIGAYNFTAQYQQRPETPDGGMIKRKYIKIIDRLPAIDGDKLYWVSIDAALSTSESADYSAFTFGVSSQCGHYVLFAERGRWDYEELLGKALSYAKQYRELTFVVEAACSGISLIQYMLKRGIRCFWSKPLGDKMVRVARVLPVFDDGRVFLVKGDGQNTWIEPFLNELVNFPHGRFDDQVDSLTQALIWADPRAQRQERALFF